MGCNNLRDNAFDLFLPEWPHIHRYGEPGAASY
jgi:hypothetical protein